jgi:hypothetical protein
MSNGKKTTEFWVTMLVTCLGAALAALGAIFPELQKDPESAPEWVRIASILGGTLMVTLAQAGYAVSRGLVKSAEAVKEGKIEAAKQEGIGLEAAAMARKAGRASSLLLMGVTCLGLVLLPACSMTLLKYDAETATQIQKTIEHEQASQAFVEGKLPGPDEIEYDVVSDAEISRLEAWFAAEEAKKLEDGG